MVRVVDSQAPIVEKLLIEEMCSGVPCDELGQTLFDYLEYSGMVFCKVEPSWTSEASGVWDDKVFLRDWSDQGDYYEAGEVCGSSIWTQVKSIADGQFGWEIEDVDCSPIAVNRSIGEPNLQWGFRVGP